MTLKIVPVLVKVVTRFTGSGDISEKLVSYIKTVPWINITAAKYVIKWNIFRLNKSLRKSTWLFEKRKKIEITLSFSTCVLVAVWRAERSYYAVTTFLDGGRNFVRCLPEIINNNSNNLYSHNNNNECIGTAQNKLRWRRKFSVSVQAQTCSKRCLWPISMTMGIEYQTLRQA